MKDTKFTPLFEKKYYSSKKNSEELISELADDVFELYFDSFESLYASSLYNEVNIIL